jgi:tetratricopeptide (TPR) repeat protein
MKLRRVAWLAVTVVACHRTHAVPADAGPQASPASPVASASVAAARDAGAATPSPETIAAYRAALLEGRRETVAKHYAKAVDAFTRALAAIPRDGRALAERGYARFLAKQYEPASYDLQLALGSIDSHDKKLAAQIEYNLGLVEDARGNKGLASGHYRLSYELAPTAAAKARMGKCPVTVSTPSPTIYASLADAKSKLDDLTELGDPKGVYTDERDGRTDVLLPVDAGRLAEVVVGMTSEWRCGKAGELTVERTGDLWKVVYQAHRATSTTGICTCDGGVCDQNGESPGQPKCTCEDPWCPLVCGGADDPVGTHLEIYVDAKTGAGVGQFELDHEYLDQVKLEADLAKRSFHAIGLGCP